MPNNLRRVSRALLSVSDKTGLIDFAKALAAQGIELLSTGGTAKALTDAGLTVRDVADITGFPEMMDGRVKTLHPKIHGGLLSIRGNPEHEAAMLAHDIRPIDLLVVNLYPFEATLAKGALYEECVENIDIGGPAMVRSAAKNWKDVGIVTDASQYADVIAELKAHGKLSDKLRFALSVAAFNRISQYDGAISNYLSSFKEDFTREMFPKQFNAQFTKVQEMRYGENPHQRGWVSGSGGLAEAPLLQGKAMSYNNYLDADSALNVLRDFELPSVVIIKHGIPAGIASADSIESAFEAALACDPVSAFGGVIASNRIITQRADRALYQRGGESTADQNAGGTTENIQ